MGKQRTLGEKIQEGYGLCVCCAYYHKYIDECSDCLWIFGGTKNNWKKREVKR